MLIKNRNNLGSINIDRHIVEKIVKYIIKDYEKNVFLTNSSGQSLKMVQFLSEDRDSHYIEVKRSGPNITIRVNVILKFGLSIKGIASEIINRVRAEVRNMTNIEVERVTICIRGIKSKKMIKRNICIEG